MRHPPPSSLPLGCASPLARYGFLQGCSFVLPPGPLELLPSVRRGRPFQTGEFPFAGLIGVLQEVLTTLRVGAQFLGFLCSVWRAAPWLLDRTGVFSPCMGLLGCRVNGLCTPMREVSWGDVVLDGEAGACRLSEPIGEELLAEELQAWAAEWRARRRPVSDPSEVMKRAGWNALGWSRFEWLRTTLYAPRGWRPQLLAIPERGSEFDAEAAPRRWCRGWRGVSLAPVVEEKGSTPRAARSRPTEPLDDDWRFLLSLPRRSPEPAGVEEALPQEQESRRRMLWEGLLAEIRGARDRRTGRGESDGHSEVPLSNRFGVLADEEHEDGGPVESSCEPPGRPPGSKGRANL